MITMIIGMLMINPVRKGLAIMFITAHMYPWYTVWAMLSMGFFIENFAAIIDLTLVVKEVYVNRPEKIQLKFRGSVTFGPVLRPLRVIRE